MDSVPNGEEPTSWDELYNINLMPSELFLKFRKEVQGIRVGLNMEFYNAPINEYQAKLVLKPLTPEWKWKIIYEPLHHDVRVLSKKIPITKFLNLQDTIFKCMLLVGNGSSPHVWAETVYPGSEIRHQLACFPVLIYGLDGGQTMYFLKLLGKALGTDEPMFNMHSGRLQASLDRVEAILTHSDAA
uniref:DUF7781 domain-containing protein n=1 Tax=Cajanus cajan TaxID=3821 RepID=A0A151SSU2_CAJCA|nr:hypothetical protein KK1_004119 [Cajanus cajan]